MVRELAFDVSEMAIVTYLMARSFGKPMVLVAERGDGAVSACLHALQCAPVVVVKDRMPTRLPFRSAGVSLPSFVLRGILANDYGVDLLRYGNNSAAICRSKHRQTKKPPRDSVSSCYVFLGLNATGLFQC